MTDNRTNEPTEAMILAGLNAYSSKGLEIDGYETTEEYQSLEIWGDRLASQMRAALVAAQEAAPPVGRRPKRLLNQLNRIADALEEYVFEGVAADAQVWMRKAAEYIESERQWRAPVLPSSTESPVERDWSRMSDHASEAKANIEALATALSTNRVAQEVLGTIALTQAVLEVAEQLRAAAPQDPERIMLHHPDGTPKLNDEIRSEAAGFSRAVPDYATELAQLRAERDAGKQAEADRAYLYQLGLKLGAERDAAQEARKPSEDYREAVANILSEHVGGIYPSIADAVPAAGFSLAAATELRRGVKEWAKRFIPGDRWDTEDMRDLESAMNGIVEARPDRSRARPEQVKCDCAAMHERDAELAREIEIIKEHRESWMARALKAKVERKFAVTELERVRAELDAKREECRTLRGERNTFEDDLAKELDRTNVVLPRGVDEDALARILCEKNYRSPDGEPTCAACRDKAHEVAEWLDK